MEAYKKQWKNSWYMTTFAGRVYKKITRTIASCYDRKIDKKICGVSLEKYVPSVDGYENATGSENARYWALQEIFQDQHFTDDDKIIDVGCGKGRFFAFFESIGFKGQLYGVELNPKVAEYTQNWAKRYDNITVYSGDAFKLNYNEYTVILLCRPFFEELYLKFIDKIQKEIDHPVKVLLYADNYMVPPLRNDPRWTMEKRDILFKKGPLVYSYCPFRYSIWTFDPSKSNEVEQ